MAYEYKYTDYDEDKDNMGVEFTTLNWNVESYDILKRISENDDNYELDNGLHIYIIHKKDIVWEPRFYEISTVED